MKKVALLILLFFAFQPIVFAQQEATTSTGERVLLWDNGTWTYADAIPLSKAITIAGLEIPQTKFQNSVVKHTGFSLLYNEMHEQASWVSYELTRQKTNKLYNRTDKFLPDPKVKTGSATGKDYAQSGFDRGHLAPAADMGWSATAMAESFYYSNMSPQNAGFNRGIWKKLEELVRTWAVENNSVYIVTGPVLTPGLKSIGINKVSVPDYFYKVILDYTDPGIKAIGFVLPNHNSSEQLYKYAVSIDSVETLTGIDFFHLLPDAQENLIEKNVCIPCWSWGSSGTLVEKESALYVQCKAKSQSGEQCSNKTLNASIYCYLHDQPSAIRVKPLVNTENVELPSVPVQCTGVTKAGNRCQRITTNTNGRCYQH